MPGLMNVQVNRIKIIALRGSTNNNIAGFYYTFIKTSSELYYSKALVI